MNKTSILDIVNADLCIGCGICVAQEGGSRHRMIRNKYGFLVPNVSPENNLSGKAVSVCPFNPNPETNVLTEDELAKLYLKDAPNYNKQVGRYHSTYVGYASKYRMTSSSGGLATYVLYELLTKKIVDGVIVVVPSAEERHYEYQLITDPNELLRSSKTKYYPVTLAEVFTKLKEFEGTIAVTGVGCFIKAIRLYQHYNPEIAHKIKFTVGIICGGIKSDFFAEYLAASAGADPETYQKPHFRIKDPNSSASDYSFGCIDSNDAKYEIKMRKVGDMWGSGLFKNNACDFCDDVTTELADISLGDAWLKPYNQDGKGTNVIVTRSKLAEKLVNEGITNDELFVTPLDISMFISSQQGSFNHRHRALGYRLKLAKNEGLIIPPKRHDNEKISIDFKWVQRQRMIVRKQSLVLWKETKNSADFEKMICNSRDELQKRTKINHYIRAIKRRIGI